MAYNSQFTGAQIDEAIADVRSNKDAWNGKQDVILASGAAVGDLIKVKAVDASGKPTAWAVAVARCAGKAKWMLMRQRLNFSAGSQERCTPGAMRVRSNLFLHPAFTGSFYFYDAFCKARNSSRLKPLARMARAFSAPTYRQCHGSNTTPVMACRSSG